MFPSLLLEHPQIFPSLLLELLLLLLLELLLLLHPPHSNIDHRPNTATLTASKQQPYVHRHC